MTAKRILIAEDEPNIAHSLTFLLERAGFDVRHVIDGDAALRSVETEAPDLLILDLMLPGIDGYEVLGRLRSEAAPQEIPVIVLTAKGQPEDRRTALESGATLFITKPYSNAAMVDAVVRLVAADD
ncbi:MAG: response regulator [Pseudomonadota bacterium]